MELSANLTHSFDDGAKDQRPSAADPVLILWDAVLHVHISLSIDSDHRAMWESVGPEHRAFISEPKGARVARADDEKAGATLHAARFSS